MHYANVIVLLPLSAAASSRDLQHALALRQCSYELTRLFSVFLLILVCSFARIPRVSTLHGKVASVIRQGGLSVF